MSTSIRAFFLGSLLLALARSLTGCGSAPACGPDTCQGCCTADGTCVPAPNAAQCGARGSLCESCGVGGFCMGGICVGGGGGNGGGTSGGNSTTTSTSSGDTTTSSGTTTGSSGWPTSGGTTSGSSTTTSGGATSGGANQAPVIQSLSANPTTLDATGINSASTTISAIVSDPDGNSDLAGGTLVDPVSGQTYGAFATPGGQGTFTYQLTWQAANSVSPLTFTSGSGSRTFNAVFYDNHGHTVSQSLTLDFECGISGDALCNGVCADLQNDANNCGSCGNAVQGGTCNNGQPQCPNSYDIVCNGACVDPKFDAQNCGACGNDCGQWATAHGISSSASQVKCQYGVCGWKGTTTSTESCASYCAGIGNGLGCYLDAKCQNADGTFTGYTNAGCASYASTGSTAVCTAQVALGCNDVPSSTEPSCGNTMPGTGTFTQSSCLCD